VFVFLGRSERHQEVILTEKSAFTAKALKDLYDSVKEEVGKGYFGHTVEVKGKIECGKPLTSELTKEECVFYKTEVERKYEETYSVTNP